ncbi:MAG: FAD-binding protein [Anaerolineae bacterium]|nr:FAD-binding protein [Anaerolineae bacterium]
MIQQYWNEANAMREETLDFENEAGEKQTIALVWVHSLVVGSGAAGLNAAVQLVRAGIEDVLILTEGLNLGTSINTGSDKQTYYKLSMCGAEADSPRLMADSYFAGGSMHGDLALIEASLSARAFLNLVNLGVPFPSDSYGQFVGYKTDHDPRQRATSIGPYTSREMCRQLIKEVQRLSIKVNEGREVVRLVVLGEGSEQRIAGVVVLNDHGDFEAYAAENVIFAVGGPGGLYKTSVYPEVHSGAIGLALMAGAKAQNLPESQYGLASTGFRWNVSGTYMQVVPRFISRAQDGLSDEKEFLPPYFTSGAEMYGNVFLKGYQWPFDARKVMGGSSIIDILVYIETVINNRRVYLDFRCNPAGFSFDDLPDEARNYLVKSGAVQNSPIERLQFMNPGAVALYLEHGINLAQEPLEIAVCAQHNNGGLAANIWWESTNIKHLFPIGEVNGSHGVSRPGGSALNSGQVGGFRAAEYISHCYRQVSLPEKEAAQVFRRAIKELVLWQKQCSRSKYTWSHELKEVQKRMSGVGAHIRSLAELQVESAYAWKQVEKLQKEGCVDPDRRGMKNAFKTLQLCFAHAVYLDAILFALNNGVGSRGSAIVLDPSGQKVHPLLGDDWKIIPENADFRSKVLETRLLADGKIENRWVNCRAIPEIDSWFETTWAAYRNGEIYNRI